VKLISFYIVVTFLLINNIVYSSKIERIDNGYSLVPLSGTYYIPGDFATINDAALSLNLNGISGPVIFNVAANHTETAPSGISAVSPGGIVFGNISGTNATNTITFQKNGVGANPIVTAGLNHFAGGIMDAVIKFIGTDYVTFDLINVRENPLNVTFSVATNNMTEFGFAFFYANTVATANGAQNNTIKNSTITLNTGGTNYQNTFGLFSTTVTSSTNGTGAASVTAIVGSNSNNKLHGNTINNCNFGITVIGSNTPAAMDIGWDIGGSSTLTGNTITNFGIGNGVAASAYQKLGITVQGILVNQIADHNDWRFYWLEWYHGSTITFGIKLQLQYDYSC
jgi:trimeric autotransporter adhesin